LCAEYAYRLGGCYWSVTDERYKPTSASVTALRVLEETVRLTMTLRPRSSKKQLGKKK